MNRYKSVYNENKYVTDRMFPGGGDGGGVDSRIAQLIDKMKAKVLAQAKRKGIYENMGQREGREINDVVMKMTGGDFSKAGKAQMDFEDWAMNVTIDDLGE